MKPRMGTPTKLSMSQQKGVMPLKIPTARRQILSTIDNDIHEEETSSKNSARSTPSHSPQSRTEPRANKRFERSESPRDSLAEAERDKKNYMEHAKRVDILISKLAHNSNEIILKKSEITFINFFL